MRRLPTARVALIERSSVRHILGRRYGDVELAFDVAALAIEQVLGGTLPDVDILRDLCSFAGPVIAVISSLFGTPR